MCILGCRNVQYLHAILILQKQKIQHAAVRYDVDVTMDYAKETVELTGFHEDVLEAEVEINKIAHEAEVEEHEAEKEAIYADMVQWYFLEVR